MVGGITLSNIRRGVAQMGSYSGANGYFYFTLPGGTIPAANAHLTGGFSR